MIGLIFATRFEARPFLSAIHGELVATQPFKVYVGANRMPIIISGIGKVAAAVACLCLIRDYGVHYVLNAGACGALHDRAGLAVGNVLRIATAREGDHTPFDRHPAPLACCNQFAATLPAVDLVTSDRPVFEPGARAYFGRLGDVVDMEGGAIARTAAWFGIPWDMVKGVSDSAGIIDRDTLKRNLQSVCEKIAQILLAELKDVEPLPTHSPQPNKPTNPKGAAQPCRNQNTAAT